MSEEVKQEGDFKIKKKRGRPRKLTSQNETVKVDLNKKEEDAVQEQTTDEVLVRDEPKVSEEVSKENIEETTEKPTEEGKEEEVIPIQEVTEEVKEEVVQDICRAPAGALQISFIMEDNFSYDEEVDEERDIRKKKLAYKEEIAKAKNFLEGLKSKYYEEIKLRPGTTQEQQKAVDFFNRYNEEQQMVQEQHSRFKSKTKNFFNQEFKGFDFNVGEKKFRYGVNNTDEVANNQSDLTNLIGKFLDNKGEVKDYNGYHKAIYAAQNADTIANHFYEQGKADAVKDMMAKSKNISNEPRATSTGDVYINGLKVKAISGVDSSKLKLRINKNKT